MIGKVRSTRMMAQTDAELISAHSPAQLCRPLSQQVANRSLPEGTHGRNGIVSQ